MLIKKAAVDAEFREVLLVQRAKAADQIGLTLEPAEALMLAAAPAAQLKAVIGQTTVPQEHRRAFLGKAAAAMLAAVAVASTGMSPPQEVYPTKGNLPGPRIMPAGVIVGPDGIRPDRLPSKRPRSVAQRVLDVVAKPTERYSLGGEVTRETTLADREAGYLNALQAALEKEFDIQVPDQPFANVGEIIEYVEKAFKDGKRLDPSQPRAYKPWAKPNPGPMSRGIRPDRQFPLPNAGVSAPPS